MNTSEVTLTKTASRPAQKVVVVNGTPDVLDLLESVLEGGRYDLLFADASQHAYSLIAKEQPNLVVLCTTIDRTDGFQLLSMLKLDPQTKRIPVVTYTIRRRGRRRRGGGVRRVRGGCASGPPVDPALRPRVPEYTSGLGLQPPGRLGDILRVHGRQSARRRTHPDSRRFAWRCHGAPVDQRQGIEPDRRADRIDLSAAAQLAPRVPPGARQPVGRS